MPIRDWEGDREREEEMGYESISQWFSDVNRFLCENILSAICLQLQFNVIGAVSMFCGNLEHGTAARRRSNIDQWIDGWYRGAGNLEMWAITWLQINYSQAEIIMNGRTFAQSGDPNEHQQVHENCSCTRTSERVECRWLLTVILQWLGG